MRMRKSQKFTGSTVTIASLVFLGQLVFLTGCTSPEPEPTEDTDFRLLCESLDECLEDERFDGGAGGSGSSSGSSKLVVWSMGAVSSSVSDSGSTSGGGTKVSSDLVMGSFSCTSTFWFFFPLL